jgi:hypothetical protein
MEFDLPKHETPQAASIPVLSFPSNYPPLSAHPSSETNCSSYTHKTPWAQPHT